jgi:hypothetical protein
MAGLNGLVQVNRRVFLAGLGSLLATTSAPALTRVRIPPPRRTSREVLLSNAQVSTGDCLPFVHSGLVNTASAEGTLAGTIVPLGTNKVYGTTQTFKIQQSGSEAAVTLGPVKLRDSGQFRVSVYRADAAAPDVLLRSEVRPLVLPVGIKLGGGWSPYVNDHLVVNGWHQEDLADGPVAAWKARGIRAAVAAQSDPALRPVKASGTGVEFPAGSRVSLQYPRDDMRQVLVRAHLTVFRVDPNGGGSGDATPIAAPAGLSGGSSNRAGGLEYNVRTRRVSATWRDAAGDNVCVATQDVNPNFGVWAFALAYRVDGRHCLKVNGAPAVVVGTNVNPMRNWNDPSYFGSPASTTTCRFAIDSRLELQGELSDAVIAKLEWWAARRAGVVLPQNHRYRSVTPVVDLDDFPVSEDKFDAGSWAKLTADAQATTFTKSNVGRPVPKEVASAFSECVFNDDFRLNSVVRGDQPVRGIWYSQGGLAYNTVGGDAALVHAGQSPNCYVHDAKAKTMALRLAYANGRWWGAAIGSVNIADQGITVRGPHMREITFRMAIPTGPVAGGYFPAPLWAYGANRSRQLTGAAFEFDDIELDGRDPCYINGASAHSHEGLIPGWKGRRTDADDRDRVKIAGTQIHMNNGYPKTVNFFDGNWHTVRLYIGEDTTYLEVDGMEVRRCPTPVEFFRRVHLLACFALVNSRGEPSRAVPHDMVLKSVRVMKRPADVQAFQAPFWARPTLGGSTKAGGDLTVAANVRDSSLIRYEYYYDDGYPIVAATGPAYRLTKADAGKRIRCKVTALGGTEQPEAWTDFSARIAR